MYGKIAAILLFSIMFRFVYISGMLTDYVVNYSQYLANCENRDKPETHCNGQCLLMKALQEAEPEHQNPSESREINHQSVFSYYLIAENTFSLYKNCLAVPVIPTYVESLNIAACFFEIFHPPKFTS
jgi:hypothetical protein